MGRGLVRTAIGVSVVGALLSVGMVAFLFASVASQGTDSGLGSGVDSGQCVSLVSGVGSVTGLDEDQLANARVIIATGAGLQVPDRGVVVALATAMQESTLRNLTYGDRDSVGLFQQRPSSGWGTVEELTTPSVAATKFYTALVKVPDWQSLAVTDAAQRVQRSAFPLAYAKWESLAVALVEAAGGNVSQLNCSNSIGYATGPGAAGDMVRVALAQQGEPYVWGATGPDSFDCSGLVVYAWRMAGYRSTVRTSEQMYAVSDPVPLGSEQPGDLIFGHFGSAGPGHVMIVVRPGLAVQAPRTGDVVKLTPYAEGQGWRIGRLQDDVLRPLAGATPDGG